MLEHSLLSEPLFRVTLGSNPAVTRLSLPQVLAQLSAGDALIFFALRPHQQPAWHAFVVQLAYLALEPLDDPRPPTDPEAWAELLRSLTPDHPDDGPWCLINTDWQAPAFLQPPCSPGRVGDFTRGANAAQDIDVLVTSRHHDEKTGKLPLDERELDALVYALIVLQGWTPVLGSGAYNTMRMNRGWGSRPQFRLAYERGSGSEFIRDLTVLLDERVGLEDRFTSAYGAQATGEHRLLWLPIWDEGSLSLESVHPYCLEVCRRVRLVRQNDRLMLRRARSNRMRVAAEELLGNVLDPWIPILIEDGVKALTAQPYSLEYRHLQSLIFDRSKVRLPLLARPSPRERDLNQEGTLIARVLVGGKGATDGWLSRELLIPKPVLAQWQSAPAELAHRSQLFVHLAGLASGKVLRSSLLQFVDGSKDVDWKNRDFVRAVEPWVSRFEAAVDEVFFSQLFHTVEVGLGDIDAQCRWVRWLAETCRAHLEKASKALPTREGSRHFALGRAQRLLALSLRKQFGVFLAPADATPSDTLPPTTDQPQEPAHG